MANSIGKWIAMVAILVFVGCATRSIPLNDSDAGGDTGWTVVDDGNGDTPSVIDTDVIDDTDTDTDTDQDCIMQTWFWDNDGDGYGNGNTPFEACTAPAGHVGNGADCDDGNAAVHPGATEICNGVNDDCDSAVDEGGVCDSTTVTDADGDGYDSVATGGDDCNDNVATVHPGATEICNGIDDDCDGATDEGGVCNTPAPDTDGDGVADTLDCAPNNAQYSTYQIWYVDEDGDGYGHNGAVEACTKPSGYVLDNTDCLDVSYYDMDAADVHPGATEVCDYYDNDCDGSVDEGLTKVLYYYDRDLDGYGDPNTKYEMCASTSSYWVTNKTDCDDNKSQTHPGAAELCDGYDNDCDGTLSDEQSECYVTVYRFKDPASQTRCWGTGTTAPSECSTFQYEREAFVLGKKAFDAGVSYVQCYRVAGSSRDYLPLLSTSSDKATLVSQGYTCRELGYAWPIGKGPAKPADARLGECDAFRFRWNSTGQGHLVTQGPDSLVNLTCEGVSATVLTTHTDDCFTASQVSACP